MSASGGAVSNNAVGNLMGKSVWMNGETALVQERFRREQGMADHQ